ncbi:MAG: MarR family winged helix-turn-helix transcriptional regulator [Candidatus Zhuqueibacterota bacterium]
MSESFSQPDSVKLAEVISRLFVNCNEKENRHVAKYGVSIVEFRCLRTLYEHESLTVNHLAQKMSLTSSRVTRIVDGLVRKKLVNRDIGETDRRVYNLSLTGAGMDLSKKLIRDYQKIHEQIMQNIPAEYQKSMIQVLEQLNHAVQNWLSLE